MERSRRDKRLVREGKVAPIVPSASGRSGSRDHSATPLQGSRLLSPATEKLRERLTDLIGAEGFDCFGITGPTLDPLVQERLRDFLDNERHGTMAWLGDDPERRSDPRNVWNDVKSVIVLGMNYGPATDPLADLAHGDRGTISVYAKNRDYHDLIKGGLKRIATNLGARARQLGLAPEFKVFVDTAPVMEKPLAEAAGIGWQGKHTNLVSRDLGSWLFLGVIFTDLDLARDTPESDHCGNCRACLDICPTDAFPAPYQIDARRCISYLTIEHKGPIDRDLRPLIGNRIYGCDDCLAVCPWNKFAAEANMLQLKARQDLARPHLADLVRLGDAAFRTFFSGSPIKRIGRGRFIRNVLIAIGNSGEASLVQNAVALLDDPDPLVRGAAVWASWRLMDADSFEKLAKNAMPSETNDDVRLEWQAGFEELS